MIRIHCVLASKGKYNSLTHIQIRPVRSSLTDFSKEKNNSRTGVMENLSRESHSIMAAALIKEVMMWTESHLNNSTSSGQPARLCPLQCAVGRCAQDVLCSPHLFPTGLLSRKYRPILRFP